MAANIFGERFFGRRQPAWHRIGTVMNTDATVSEAMKYVDVDGMCIVYTAPIWNSRAYSPPPHRAADGAENADNARRILRCT